MSIPHRDDAPVVIAVSMIEKWSEDLHPRAPPGSEAGGQFTENPDGGGSSSGGSSAGQQQQSPSAEAGKPKKKPVQGEEQDTSLNNAAMHRPLEDDEFVGFGNNDQKAVMKDPHEEKTLKQWTGRGFKSINAVARGEEQPLDKPHVFQPNTADVRSVADLDRMIERNKLVSDDEVWVYRGVKNREGRVSKALTNKAFEKGEAMVDRGFSSWTGSAGTARQFAGETGMVLARAVRKSDSVSTMHIGGSGEDEYVTARNNSMSFVSTRERKDSVGNTYNYHVVELKPVKP